MYFSVSFPDQPIGSRNSATVDRDEAPAALLMGVKTRYMGRPLR
jgi:hypothetical protein